MTRPVNRGHRDRAAPRAGGEAVAVGVAVEPPGGEYQLTEKSSHIGLRLMQHACAVPRH